MSEIPYQGGHVRGYGWISPNGAVDYQGTTKDGSHDGLAERVYRHQMTGNPTEFMIEHGYFRYVISSDGEAWIECNSIREQIKGLKHLLRLPQFA